ncbi:hypothetical protein HPY173_02290 [Helicobacter pylori]|nr:hypothetical protein HPY173_02290 [Helicobacter pylori]
MKSFSLPLTKPPKDRIFKRLLLALRKALLFFWDKLSYKLRFFQKFKLSFFFFDLILGVILISLKRKSYESDTKHR